MDASAKLPVEDAVDVERSELRIVGQQLVDGLFNLGKPGGSILKLQQLLYTDKLTAFENGLALVVNKDVTIRCVCLADEHKTDTKLLLYVGSKLFVVGTEITVFLKDGTKLLTSPIVGAVVFQCVLHDELQSIFRNNIVETLIRNWMKLWQRVSCL